MGIYDKGAPHVSEIKKGDTVYICQCGLTSNPPFCDGSHQTTDKTPLAHTSNEDGMLFICGCGKTGNGPWCDGSHSS